MECQFLLLNSLINRLTPPPIKPTFTKIKIASSVLFTHSLNYTFWVFFIDYVHVNWVSRALNNRFWRVPELIKHGLLAGLPGSLRIQQRSAGGGPDARTGTRRTFGPRIPCALLLDVTTDDRYILQCGLTFLLGIARWLRYHCFLFY